MSGDESGKQNAKEPFKPPYVEELYVGTLEGIEGEEGMSILVGSFFSTRMNMADLLAQ